MSISSVARRYELASKEVIVRNLHMVIKESGVDCIGLHLVSGVSKFTVYNLSNGTSMYKPSIQTSANICKAMGVTLNSIIQEVQHENDC